MSIQGNMSAIGDKPSEAVRPEARKLRFGTFEVDLQEQELYNRGIRVGLQHKPFRILELLLRKRGLLVTRTELAEYLWPNLHVSFDRGLNTAVNVLRRALGDSPGHCRYIETRSGLGYRFVAQVEEIGEPGLQVSESQALPAGVTPHGLSKKYTASLEAYQDYLRGRYFYSKMTEEDLRRSIAHFESALQEDASFAPAYAGLANTYTLFAVLGLLPAAAAHARARDYALAALQIDHKLPEAHAALASIKKMFDWDWRGAERGYGAALELNPNYVDARHGYAALLCSLGQAKKAREEIRRAQELDPLSIPVAHEAAWTLYMSRDFEGAIEQSWKTLALEARYAPAQHTLGLACEQLGMFEEAITELENARACSSEHPVTIAALAHVYASWGNRAEALRKLAELEEIARRRHVSPYWVSIAQTGLGGYEAAFEWLEKAFEERDVWLVWMGVEPRLDPLRSDARFKGALRRLGLA